MSEHDRFTMLSGIGMYSPTLMSPPLVTLKPAIQDVVNTASFAPPFIPIFVAIGLLFFDHRLTLGDDQAHDPIQVGLPRCTKS